MPEKTSNNDFITGLCAEFLKNNKIDAEQYVSYNVKRGLRNADGTGVMAGLTLIGNVQGYVVRDGDKSPIEGRLIYRGIDVKELVKGFAGENRFGFEETAYLLLFGELPTAGQLEEFIAIIDRCRDLPEGFVEDMVIKAPSNNIMNKLERSVLALYSYDENPDDISLPNLMRQSVQLIARFPSIVAAAFAVKRHYYDGDSLILHAPKSGFSIAENFLRLVRPDSQYTEEEARLLDLCLVLHAEHGGGNNSAFSCRVLSSSGTDTYSAIAAAVGSLKGPRHGGANIKVMEMFSEIMANVKNWTDDEEVSAYLAKIIRKEAGDGSGLVYGMGHAVYTVSDPRTGILKEFAAELAAKNGMTEEFELMSSVERLSQKVFSEVKRDTKMICANVDMYSGLVYKLLGIPEELYTAIFAISRITGWVAHRIEEVLTGGRIIRPAYKAVSKERSFVPIGER